MAAEPAQRLHAQTDRQEAAIKREYVDLSSDYQSP